MNFNRISQLSNLITNDLKRKPTIILEPNRLLRIFGTANDMNVSIDAANWIIPDSIKEYITEICIKDTSIEEKILELYKKICEEYTYDDNVLSYIKRNDDETFFLPDEYGRAVDKEWEENRSNHNRRNCFEVSRILAKSIKELLKRSGKTRNYDVCIIWDEAVTHYFVGLVSDEYCLSLDLDDFTQMKDLTRVKTGLTIEGIKILSDPQNRFRPYLEKENAGKERTAKEQIESERKRFKQDLETERSIDLEDIEFLNIAIQILKERYDLDSAGIYEYMKEIVDTRIGGKSRKKLWKEVETSSGTGKRYTRCLMVTIDDISYIIDVTKDNPSQMLRRFDPKELHMRDSQIISYNDLERSWKDDPYDGR